MFCPKLPALSAHFSLENQLKCIFCELFYAFSSVFFILFETFPNLVKSFMFFSWKYPFFISSTTNSFRNELLEWPKTELELHWKGKKKKKRISARCVKHCYYFVKKVLNTKRRFNLYELKISWRNLYIIQNVCHND